MKRGLIVWFLSLSVKLADDQIVARILEEAEIPEEQAREACIVIQNAYRSFKIRHEREKQLLSGVIDWRVAARSAIKLYRRTGVSHEEAKRAANLIKVNWRAGLSEMQKFVS